MPTFLLTEIIKEPTGIYSSSCLLNHILTNSSEKNYQKRLVEVGISNHQLIYCTKKTNRIKHNKHSQIQVKSLKKYGAEIFTNSLKTVQFQNHDIFFNVNVTNSDHLNTVLDTTNVVPIKYIRIKQHTRLF